ncbi:MAG: 4-(cytidine 5'-diphospho)-2-C-methyl-D-erythritol kinase [Syntrophorhabdaceae bacterium]|nr:4-(cytidine 5'-diphospho)-2-C-methyl-D-erythritol kinase [Syntrophorhabdaceae bacterium]
MSLPSSISFLAPAKLNLFLRVFGKRPDGYHDIRSVMTPVSLYDEVILEKAAEANGITVECDAAEVPTDETNSCWRAASLFREWCGFTWGVRITIRKRIPVEAGLGGGSSDAAATLKCLCALTGLRPSPAEYLSMAARIGADVPFFTMGTTALVEGYGDILTPMPLDTLFYAVIVKPSFGLSTREGYARLKRDVTQRPESGNVPLFPSLTALALSVRNDFEDAWAMEFPEIARIKEELLSAGALAAGLSGSGSALFGLFPSESEAREGLAQMQNRSVETGARKYFVAGNIL